MCVVRRVGSTPYVRGQVSRKVISGVFRVSKHVTRRHHGLKKSRVLRTEFLLMQSTVVIDTIDTWGACRRKHQKFRTRRTWDDVCATFTTPAMPTTSGARPTLILVVLIAHAPSLKSRGPIDTNHHLGTKYAVLCAIKIWGGAPGLSGPVSEVSMVPPVTLSPNAQSQSSP